MRKQSIRHILLFLSTTLFFLVVLTACIYLYIPTYLASRIPGIARDAGIENLTADVRHVGFFGADIGPLTVGGGIQPAISLDSVKIHYTPRALLSKHIDSIVFSGLDVHGEYADGVFTIPGLDIEKMGPQRPKGEADPGRKASLPAISIGRIEFRHSVVIVKALGSRMRLPLTLQIVPEAGGDTFALEMQLYPRDQLITVAATVHIDTKTIALSIRANNLRPDVFSDYLKKIPFPVVTGSLDIDGNAEIGFAPFHIREADITGRFSNIRIAYHGLQLTSMTLPFHFSATYSENKDWTFNLSDAPTSNAPGVALTLGEFSIITGQPDISIAGRGNDTDVSATYHVKIPRVRATGKGATINMPALTIRGKVDLAPTASGSKHVTLTLDAPDTRIAANSTRLHLPDMSLKGEYTGDSFNDARVNGEIAFSRGTLIDKERQVSVGNIAGHIPFGWPLGRKGGKGKLSAENIRWKNIDIGSLKGVLYQDRNSIVVRATHHSKVFSGLSVDITASGTLMATDRPPVEISVKIDRYSPSSDIDLGGLFPAARGVAINGTLDADARITMGDSGIAGSLRTKLTDATILMADKGLTIEGINVDLTIPDLNHLRSAPEQHLSFDRISFGELYATEGKVDFQIESADSFFIEKSSLKWCDGRLYTHALRITPGGEDYSLIVYADRLKLAALLRQVGSVKAEGEGTLNGRIPIRIKNKTFRFADGFLYSTPGEGGRIRLTETEVLTAGIPENTPQHAQLELAREALKDYDYKWVKLNIETEEDMLHLGMQLDGKPANPLPFVYRKELGSFARIEAGGKGSIFQGISLNVNFKVPIDKILRYGKSLKDVFDMSR